VREVKAVWPETTTTPAILAERLRTQLKADMDRFPIGDKAARLSWLETLLKPKLLLASTEPKPIPAPLDKLPAAQLRQAYPLEKLQDDPDAALLQAKGGETLELPLTLGIYDGYNRKWTYSASVTKEQLQPGGGYHLYKVASGATLTPSCCFWASQLWVATVALEQFYVVGYPDKKWDIYASLKVEGPGYDPKSTAAKNMVWCDRVVLVELPGK